MPITHRIDSERRLVLAAGHGKLTIGDFFGYQQTVWSRPEVAGFDELMDMTDVDEIVEPSVDRILELAALASKMSSSSTTSRFAIVAPTDLTFGLGRMFQAFRAHEDSGARKVAVFRTPDEAMAFLGVEREPPRR
jgi:hypothetical protein